MESETTKQIELFGKRVEIRKADCLLYDEPPRDISRDRVNLFIQLNNSCNANCKYCEYHGRDIGGIGKNFNYSKLAEIMQEIHSHVSLGKLNFTGGEPTLDMGHFDKTMQVCVDNSHSDLGLFTINTNGIHLKELMQYMNYVDYIALSRHHYDDEKNFEIFGTDTVPTSRDILEFQIEFKYNKKRNPYRLNGRCNLIKGYIDSIEEVKKYLEWCASVNMLWIGLVTLMPLNKYCKDNEVLADGLISDPEFLRNQVWKRWEQGSVECQCADYIYTSKNNKLVIFYNRIFCNKDLKAGQLVYDGQNLRLGFSGEIIY